MADITIAEALDIQAAYMPTLLSGYKGSDDGHEYLSGGAAILSALADRCLSGEGTHPLGRSIFAEAMRVPLSEANDDLADLIPSDSIPQALWARLEV